MAAATHAENLLTRVNPTVPEDFKGSMDGKTILNFIHQCEPYFSLVAISNQYMQALFAARLL